MFGKFFSALDRQLKQLALATTTPQLRRPVSTASSQEYISEAGYRKLGWRALRRRLVFLMSGQAKSKINSLTNAGRRGLWLYFGEGQIGDALMDLAPRSLLHARGFSMDLLTDKHIARLFEGDPWFTRVTGDISAAVKSAAPGQIVTIKVPLRCFADAGANLRQVDNAATVISRLHSGKKRLVFCDSRARVEQLAAHLRQLGVDTYVSHSSLSLDERR